MSLYIEAEITPVSPIIGWEIIASPRTFMLKVLISFIVRQALLE